MLCKFYSTNIIYYFIDYEYHCVVFKRISFLHGITEQYVFYLPKTQSRIENPGTKGNNACHENVFSIIFPKGFLARRWIHRGEQLAKIQVWNLLLRLKITDITGDLKHFTPDVYTRFSCEVLLQNVRVCMYVLLNYNKFTKNLTSFSTNERYTRV